MHGETLKLELYFYCTYRLSKRCTDETLAFV